MTSRCRSGQTYGVAYDAWDESWPWIGETQSRFERFDRLLRASDYARQQTARERHPRTATVPFDAAPSSPERPYETPRRGRDTAFAASPPETTRLRRIRVFSEEKKSHSAGRSVWTFFATDYGTLWKQMAARKLQNLHFYEIIEEDQPCHLYFDLEFQTEFNPDLDGNALVQLLLKLFEGVMQRRWGLSLEDAFVMEMDATTPQKFSRHLIIRLKRHVFRNNAQIKPIIHEILTAASGAFTVEKADGKGCFIDDGVYSKNRSFRMLWCSKSGKQNQLKPSKRFSLEGYTGSGRRHTQRLFYLSLISNVCPGMQLLEVVDDFGSFRGGALSCTASKMVHDKGRSFELLQRAKEDYGPCHFQQKAICFAPVIENLVQYLFSETAIVTKVNLLGYDGLASYNLTGPGSHFCLLLGRAHKSNHVYYMVDLQSLRFQQRCYDPECNNHLAEWDIIPESLLTANDAIISQSSHK